MSRQYQVYHVDAFTDKTFGGNAAGVVPEAEGLSEAEMQQIARELNLSETTFLTKSSHEGADFRIRFFTPSSEIPFCGHATIGAAWLLAKERGWTEKAEQVVFQSNIGIVPVEWQQEDGELKAVVMTQVSPQVRPVETAPEEIARIVGLAPSDLDERYPVRLANTGNWHLIIPVKSRALIDGAKPDLAALEALNRAQQVATTHLFTFDTEMGEYDVYTRDFAPAVGIPEDPVTGSANGALAGYLMREGILNNRETQRLTIAQGHSMGRPGTVYATMTPYTTPREEEVLRVQIGGAAVMTISGVLSLA